MAKAPAQAGLDADGDAGQCASTPPVRAREPPPTSAATSAAIRSAGAATCPTVERVLLGDAWPGIAVELVARGRNVEKLFTVAPGADARRIAIQVGGAKRWNWPPMGRWSRTPATARWRSARRWRGRTSTGCAGRVDVKYALAGKRYGFALGEHDRAHAVVIDPVLAYTYLGGAADDFLWGIVVTRTATCTWWGIPRRPRSPGPPAAASPR